MYCYPPLHYTVYNIQRKGNIPPNITNALTIPGFSSLEQNVGILLADLLQRNVNRIIPETTTTPLDQ